MSTVGRLIYSVWALVAAAFLATGAVACGDGAGAPAASPTPTEAAPSPTLAPITPTPTPTPIVEAVPEGWERHTTAHIQVDVPVTWHTYDSTEETREAVLEVVGSWNPEFVPLIQQYDLDKVELAAFDSESVEFLTNFAIELTDNPVPTTIPAVIAGIEEYLVAARGMGEVLATDVALTIGGLKAGSIQTSGLLVDSLQTRDVTYLVQTTPTVIFSLFFVTTADRFPALQPVFEQIAHSFRVLEAS